MAGKLLDNVNSPEDIKKLNIKELNELSEEIREFLIDSVSNTGGHLASNLGVVELSIALHKVFETPKDKIIWDVGHQSYVHKIITGRKDKFHTLRQFGGISGFPRSTESEHDFFDTGHSSTSISAALGTARARDLKRDDYSVIAVIGDGALTGGMAFEALNDAGRSNTTNLIVILNDNEMSIARNVGGMSKYLSKIRTGQFYSKFRDDVDHFLKRVPLIGKGTARAIKRLKSFIKYIVVPGVIFEELGFKYFGPIDGHDIANLTEVLSRARHMKGPVFIHVCTHKGKGYSHAEEKPHEFHSVAPFEVETGEKMGESKISFSDIFGEEVIKLAEKDEKIVAITASMTQGTGLEEFSKRFRSRFFDVGIAEQHAVTMAAGMAKNGLKPVFGVYSTFLQRAYDQIIHDVALQKLNVLFGIDRAGLVGEDGETHQGIFDLSYLRHIPNLTILAPCDYSEFRKMLQFSLTGDKGPVAIRYPRGTGFEKIVETDDIVLGKGVKIKEGTDLTIVAVGNMVVNALEAAKTLEKLGISAEVINARFIKPLDEKLILRSASKTKKVVTIEDNSIVGGFGSSVMEVIGASDLNVKIKSIGFPDEFVRHGSRNKLLQFYGMDIDSLVKDMINFINRQ